MSTTALLIGVCEIDGKRVDVTLARGRSSETSASTNVALLHEVRQIDKNLSDAADLYRTRLARGEGVAL